MKFFTPVFCISSLLALASCGPASHATCKDSLSTQNYSLKWMDDLAAAKSDGKLTVEQVVDIQGRSFAEMGFLKSENWAGFCNKLDLIRTDTGF